jgi:Cof subfamily protein (haloacid dehalogenase superfamily)
MQESITRGDFRLLVVDVDGTLVGASGVPSDGVKRAVAAAQDRGVRVALCSGRPLASCWPIARELALGGPHVVFNGALVKDPTAAEPVLCRPIPMDAAREVVDYCRAHELCLELYDQSTHYVERDRLESQLHAQSIRVTYEIGDFDDLLKQGPPIKFQIVVGDPRAKDLTAELARRMGDRLGFSTAIPMAPAEGMECVNIVAAGVSKGLAIRSLLEYYGLTKEQCVGAGDAPNDLPLFAEVGFRVVMGNASDEIKSLADYVAPDVEADGLATAIGRLFL